MFNHLHPEVKPYVVLEYNRMIVKHPGAPIDKLAVLAETYVYDIALADTLMFLDEVMA